MPYPKKLSVIAILALLVYSCSDNSQTRWTSLVSSETSFIIVPGTDATLDSVLTSQYIPFLDDVSSSAIQVIARIDSAAARPLPLKSILLYPGTDQKLQPVWVTQSDDDFVQTLKAKYAREFAQNEYQFNETPILSLQIDNRRIFAAQINNLLLISEASLGIEHSIRAYRGFGPAADLDGLAINPGTIIVNTPSLDQWVSQLARVTYHPSIKNAFKGTRPVSVSFTQNANEQETQVQLSGTIPLSGDAKSPLVSTISNAAGPITLDQYISSNAAAYGIFQSPPPNLPTEAIPDTTDADDFLLNNPEEYDQFAGALGSEFAIVMYTQSGFLSTGEHLFIRKVSDSAGLRNELEQLKTRASVEKVEDVYFVQSYLLGRLIGSRLSDFKDFYVNITGDAVVISKRKGLAEMVASDRNRRRVISYNQSYQKIKDTLADELSSLFVAGPEFYSFLTPFLAGENYVDALTSPFNYIALTTRLDEQQEGLSLNISTFKGQQNNNPYQENWLFSTGGAALSGNPVFGNVGGSFNDEVAFATKTGNVYVIAADGTLVQEYNTGSDVPVGSPVIYDWYGSGEKVILIAAGNKIYGWDAGGDLLPKFPFELNEQITTPLTIADLDENRFPDAVVATADRKLHVLSGRGSNLTGWPVTTNTRVNSAPVVDYVNGRPAVIAFSSNAVHAWGANANPVNDFPIFVDAALRGSPLVFEDNILGNSVDGNLYSVGNQLQFTDSLDVSASSPNVSAVYVANGSLTGTPSTDALTVSRGGNNFSEEMILTTSASGSVFLLSKTGQLRLTKSMGQPSADNWSSFITDINSDGKSDIVALANYGRLYAWDIETGDRIFDLPTTGMSYLGIKDVDGDGLKELVAQTEDGVQSWTINRGQ